MIMAIAGGFLAFFVLIYAFLAAAVLHHLYHYTMPGWTAAKFVVPLFFLLSAVFFAFAIYFFFTTPWQLLGA